MSEYISNVVQALQITEAQSDVIDNGFSLLRWTSWNGIEYKGHSAAYYEEVLSYDVSCGPFLSYDDSQLFALSCIGLIHISSRRFNRFLR